MENRNAITALTVRDAHTFLPAAVPPLVLDDDEAVALAIGLRGGTGRDRRIEESSERALANIVRIIPPHLRRRAVRDDEPSHLEHSAECRRRSPR
jgi:predicted DNA-binding transcriptional regulator YafY